MKEPRNVRPVPAPVAAKITALCDAMKKYHGADFAIYVQVHGERVAEYSVVTGWCQPKVEESDVKRT